MTILPDYLGTVEQAARSAAEKLRGDVARALTAFADEINRLVEERDKKHKADEARRAKREQEFDDYWDSQ